MNTIRWIDVKGFLLLNVKFCLYTSEKLLLSLDNIKLFCFCKLLKVLQRQLQNYYKWKNASYNMFRRNRMKCCINRIITRKCVKRKYFFLKGYSYHMFHKTILAIIGFRCKQILIRHEMQIWCHKIIKVFALCLK